MGDGWRRGMSRKSSLHLQRRSKAVQVGKEFGVHPKGVTRLDFCFGKMEGRRSGCMWGREVGSSEESRISSSNLDSILKSRDITLPTKV